MFARRIGRDHRLGPARRKPIAQRSGVIGAIGKQFAARTTNVQQSACTGEVMGVAGRKRESDRPTGIVGQRVDFRRPSPARGANGVMMSPPFAPAAERCALT